MADLKIIYIASNALPSEKAMSYQIFKNCEAFTKNNHKVQLLYMNRKDNFLKNNYEAIFNYYNIQKTFELKAIPFLQTYSLKKRFHFLWSLLDKKKTLYFVRKVTFSIFAILFILKNKKNIDIIYSRDKFSLFFLLLFKKLISVKLTFEIHNFSIKSKMRNFVAKHVDYCVVVTSFLKKRYVETGVKSNRIKIEPDGIDLEQFNISCTKNKARDELNLDKKIQIASYIGRFQTMDMEKGIPDIINSAINLNKELHNLYFYFVGGPLSLADKYRELIKNAGLSQDRFIFLDKQPVKDVPIWLKASDILLMPHPKKTFYSYFVSPLKMFEYMASKRPIVASKLPAIEEILTDKTNALLGIPGDAESIANNIKEILNNAKLGESLAKNAYEKVKNFTWDKRVNRIISFIKDKKC